MSTKYKAAEISQAYFITITTVGWVDVFTRLNQKYVIVNALKYCQEQKSLVIFAYCLMHSHLHLLCMANGNYTLCEIMRDFKKFTSKKVIEIIHEEPESRREWLLEYFKNLVNIYQDRSNIKYGKMDIMQKKCFQIIG